MGRVDNICNKDNGTCACRTGFMNRQCDACLPGFYDFANGCLRKSFRVISCTIPPSTHALALYFLAEGSSVLGRLLCIAFMTKDWSRRNVKSSCFIGFCFTTRPHLNDEAQIVFLI